ncbi:MAG TPA: hypothetical protein VM577_00815 [Anaerovoracaceae bacterium]|nr:hypothetical protein [Anaerovoracaceae bacterium]
MNTNLIFIWAWNVEGRTYVNQTQSLGNIIENVIEDLFNDDSEIELEVTEDSNTMTVTYLDPQTDEMVTISCEALPHAVATMLEELTGEYDKDDTFAIKELDYSEL